MLFAVASLGSGCAVLRPGGGSEPRPVASLTDSAAVDPAFILSCREQIDAAMALYAFGEIKDFTALRDSLQTRIDALAFESPSIVLQPEFAQLQESLAQLDSLCPAGLGHNYLAEDDSLALSSAPWPEFHDAPAPGAAPTPEDSPFPYVWNDRIEFWVRYFQGPGKDRFQRALYSMELHRPTVERILAEQGLHKDIICIALIESGFHLKARSYAKAVGPWQFIEGTARIYGLRVDWWYDERRDIVASTYAASNYLKDLYGVWNDWFLAFAAYNCGEGRVARAITRQKTQDFWALELPKQTERYVPKFLAALYIVREPEKYGFVVPEVEPVAFDEVTVRDATDIKLIAQFCDASTDHLAELNPSLLRWCTPPQMEIAVKVPAGRGEECARKLDAVPPDERVTWRKHQIRSGETLSGIATRYNTSVAALQSLNRIKNSHRIRVGGMLIVPVHGAHAEVASSKPQYRETRRNIDRAALENYAKKSEAPSGHKRVVYVVKKNDTLGEIAERHRTTAAKIRRWNKLAYRSYIHPGQKLVIYVPQSFGAPRASAAAASTDGAKQTYTVKKGDTFYSISKKLNVELSDLLAWNGKSSRSVIYPGDILVIR